MVAFDESALAIAYLTILIVPVLIGLFAGISKKGYAGKISSALCAVSCVSGILCYPVRLYVGDLSYVLPVSSALGDYRISVDLLGSIFVSISSLVFFMTLIHMTHSGHDYSPKYYSLVCGLFLSCTLCMAADSVILLLLSWECVSLLTFILADNVHDDRPRWLFFAITHIGGLLLMCSFGYMWLVAGTDRISQWADLSDTMGTTVSCLLIFMVFIGFGSKLGTIPFHAWMPDMYAESPTHTTVLLTTVCSNVAVLILFKTIFSFIGVGEYAIPVASIICALSAVTILWGAMEAMIQNEPKKILAYSSMENMGLVTLFLSLSMVFSDIAGSLQTLAVIAALLHTINHSVFKSLMLLSVDSIEDVTGEHKISKYGGLACVLPALSLVSFIGVASMSAIPPTNGFISEWIMLQSLMGSDAITSELRILMPLLIALMGVSGMIVATAYARLYGFIFLGRPRSKGAESPKKMRKGSIMPLVILAGLCICMGFSATYLMDAISEAVSSISSLDPGYRESLSGNTQPLILALMIAGIAIVLFAITRLFRHRREITETWGCGGYLDENMQYSSEGFSQPIVKVFHPFYGDESHVEGGRFRTKFKEPFVRFIYEPIGKALEYTSNVVSRIQTGNIQSYLAYTLITLLVALLAVRLL